MTQSLFRFSARPTAALRAIDVSHSYGDRVVLDDFHATIDSSTRLGLIGENGAGKSTLLRLLAGVEHPNRGEIHRPDRCGYFAQESPLAPSASVGELIALGLRDIKAIERELDTAARALAFDTGSSDHAASERYAEALSAAERAEIWTVDQRRQAMLAGFGVEGIDPRRRLRDISGGQRSRLALASLLLGRPDALVLDEPTNHLDDGVVEYLRALLVQWPGPVVFASHDRSFLDEAATSLIDLDSSLGPYQRFGGHTGSVFSDYLLSKASQRERWQRRYDDEQAELARLHHSVETTSRSILATDATPRDNNKMAFDFRAGKVARQSSRRVRNALRRRDEATDAQAPAPPPVLRFVGMPSQQQNQDQEVDTEPVLQLRQARVTRRLDVDRLTVGGRSRVLVTGANGSGKSTLLEVLAGRTRLDDGRLVTRANLRVELLPQDTAWSHPSRSPRRLYSDALGEDRAQQVPLASLGLFEDVDIDRPVGALSMGQQRRLSLALVIARPSDVLLVDEPTNHLSLRLATELEEALGTYAGALVIATHDRWLRQRFEGDEERLSAGRVSN